VIAAATSAGTSSASLVREATDLLLPRMVLCWATPLEQSVRASARGLAIAAALRRRRTLPSLEVGSDRNWSAYSVILSA
jgi:hypothetical protein